MSAQEILRDGRWNTRAWFCVRGCEVVVGYFDRMIGLGILDLYQNCETLGLFTAIAAYNIIFSFFSAVQVFQNCLYISKKPTHCSIFS